MTVGWAGFAEALEPRDVVYLTDGTVRLRVDAVRARRGRGRHESSSSGARCPRRQGINVPGELNTLPAVPEEDLELLRFGESMGVDMVALSFVRRAEDITEVREHTRLPLIAKIEKPQAVAERRGDRARRPTA